MKANIETKAEMEKRTNFLRSFSFFSFSFIKKVDQNERGSFVEVMHEVVLSVDSEGGEILGIAITGGSDDNIHLGDSSVYINKFIPEGVALKDGRLRVGDRIVEVSRPFSTLAFMF